MHQHTSVLSTEVSLTCHGRRARLSLREMAPSPSKKKIGPGQPSLADVYRPSEKGLARQQRKVMSHFEQQEKKLDKLVDEITRLLDQRVASLEHDARQPRLAMVLDRRANTKTRERTEGVAKAAQAKHGDSCTEQRVYDGPKISTCFGVMAEPPALPCRDDVVVENGAAAPKSCLPSLEMRSPTAAGGSLPTGEASIATMTTYNQPPLRLYSTEETDSKKTNLRARIIYVSYDSSFLPAAPPAGGSRQNPGKTIRLVLAVLGRLRACPFLRTWRALLCGEIMRVGAGGDDLQRFFRGSIIRDSNTFRSGTGEYLRRTYSGQSLVPYS